MVQTSRSMPGDAPRRGRQKDVFVLTLLALLAIGLWLLATSSGTSSLTHIVTTIYRAQVFSNVYDGPDHAAELDLIRARRERFSRKHSKDTLSSLSKLATWPLSISSSYLNASTSSHSAARAWEHLVKDGASTMTDNIGPGHRNGRRLEIHRGRKFAQRVQRRFSAKVLEAIEESAQSGRTVGAQPVDEQKAAELDWQTYLLYYPELRKAGIDTDLKATQHYLSLGRREGRVHKRLRVFLRYTACSGLINQHYSHIAAFVLSAALRSEILLPPAVQRDSFGKYFSTRKSENEVSWTPVPLESLLDVEKIIETWLIRGMTVHKTPALLPFPDLTEPQTAYPLYQQQGLDERFIVRMDNVYLQKFHLDDLVERVRSTIMQHARQLLRQNPNTTIDYIALDLPCTFFMLETVSNLSLVSEVARTLTFAPAMHELADEIISRLTKGGQLSYNAAHLRVEKDARDWSIIMGGDGVIWQLYKQAMREARFNVSTPLYIASGLLTYGANEEMAKIQNILIAFDSCSEIFYKEMFLGQDVLEGLSSEQKALVDFIVLAGGQGLVGFGSSTFSFYLREYRALKGISRASSVLVNASAIGSDSLFRSAGTVTS